MSYSRWSNSVWYTFWTSFSEDTKFKLPTKRLKNNQYFEICDLQSYHVSYGEIDEIGIDNVIKEIKYYYSKSYNISIMGEETVFKKDVTEEEWNELKGYLLAFVDDIDEHFQWNTFFKYEWYYPVRNKIYFFIRKYIK